MGSTVPSKDPVPQSCHLQSGAVSGAPKPRRCAEGPWDPAGEAPRGPVRTLSAQSRHAAAHDAIATWAGAGMPGVFSWGRTRHSLTPTTSHGLQEPMK